MFRLLCFQIDWLCKEMKDDRECDNVEEISEFQRNIEIYEQGMQVIIQLM